MWCQHRKVYIVTLVCSYWLINGGLVHAWSADDYWNSRYGSEGISYSLDDTRNGLWSDDGSLREPYLYPSSEYSSASCSCDCQTADYVHSCSGAVSLVSQSFSNISAETFTGSVSTLKILDCSSFNLLVNGSATFTALTSMTEMLIQVTGLTSFPDVSTTNLQYLNLANNKITFFRHNHTNQVFPNSLTHVALMNNEISWVPDGLFSGSSIRILSLSGNQIRTFPSSAFHNMPNLEYLGLDGNLLKSISTWHLTPLASSNLMHLNISNNQLTSIGQSALAQLPELRILEVHQNEFSSLPWKSFHNIPKLVHLDLNNNRLQTLNSRALTSLPKLQTLRLHSQKDPLTAIMFDAFVGIGSEMRTLWISDNGLQNFPHQVLSEEAYPMLTTIYADHNSITDVTIYGSEGFPSYSQSMYTVKKVGKIPFQNITAVRSLYLDSNLINTVNETDFCAMSNLNLLSMNYTQLTEDGIHANAFACLSVLSTLLLNGNQFQYVPEAVKYASVLPSIDVLDMSSNRITFLLAGTFSTLDTLRTLGLASNDIISIENGTFPTGIRYLDLGYNDFRFLHENPFTNLSNLIKLDLATNNIQVIPETAFDGCSELDNLDLSNNQIGRILKTHFEDNPLERKLDLSNNDIAYIEDGTLAHLTSLSSSLDLSNNKLTSLPNGRDFNDLSVGNLNLYNNRITSLPSGMFKNLAVSMDIDLRNNKIAIIEADAFSSVSVSLDLMLTGNPLKVVKGFAFNTTSCRNLEMSNVGLKTIEARGFTDVSTTADFLLTGNSLGTLPSYAFNGLSVGSDLYLDQSGITELGSEVFGTGTSISSTLHLQDNQLVRLEADVFTGASFTDIDLSNNLMVAYPGPALSALGLTKLKLSQNQITDIPDGSFVGQSSLRNLDLSRNSIATVRSTVLSPLTGLNQLKLQNNQIQRIEDGAFDGLNSLTTLRLDNNIIPHLPAFDALTSLTTIDVSDNQIKTLGFGTNGTFLLLLDQALNSVDFSNNPLSCDCYTYFSLSRAVSKLTSARCDSPNSTVGYGFDTAASQQYSDLPLSTYQCSAINVTAIAPAAYQIQVDWAHPAFLYPTQAAGNTSQWLYLVHCESAVASTLNTTIAGSASPRALFVQTDGVQLGTDYICFVQLQYQGFTSGFSSPAYVTTILSSLGNSSAQAADYIVISTYYDFSLTHSDFTGTSTTAITQPRYVSSPYGAWPAMSSNPTLDTYSDWFRTVAGTNVVVHVNMTLSSLSGTAVPTHRFHSSAFYPLDGVGYGAEGQRDCNSVLHNFGFTTAIRAGFKFTGRETFTIAGGEEIWLYLNKVLVLEITLNATASNIICKKVDISAAANTGGGSTIVQEGILVGDQCTNLVTVSSEAVQLELQVGELYHFDLFHVERILCTSQLFIETTSAVIVDDTPPMDYTVPLDEDFHVDGLLTTLALTDDFSVGPNYQISILSGNEARHFTIKEDTAANRAAAVAPTTSSPLIFTNISGVPVEFLVCPNPITFDPEPVYTDAETYTVSTTSALLTLNTTLDYEVQTSYYVALTVVDSGNSLTGTIAVRVWVSDLNDNCPILVEDAFSFEPIPALKQDPIIILNVSDADSGVNSELSYYVSDVSADPPLNYSNRLDLYREVYVLNTTLTFNIVIIDGGSPPRGTTANVSLTLSNTCLVSASFEPIDYNININATTMEVYLRIPKYWVFAFECMDLLGMASGIIQDRVLSASSYEYLSPPGRGRLNLTLGTGGITGGWVPDVIDANQYIEVNMEDGYKFQQIMTQGQQEEDNWVTSFMVTYSDSGAGPWTTYVDQNGTSIFDANSDRNTIVTVTFTPPIFAQYLRVNPVTWHNRIALRMELVGCAQAEQKYYDVSCVRCLTSYYCEGDGIMHSCARCDNVTADGNDTCGRSPTEHSFGLQSECSPCPTGWICSQGYATPCVDFTYADYCNDSYCPDSCASCELGYACRGGQRYQCDPGTYSDGNLEFCEMCAPGTFQNESGQDSCLPCDLGKYSSKSKDRCDWCPTGMYSMDGNNCQACLAGQCRCLQDPYPCSVGSACHDTSSGNHVCDTCSPGYEGDGANCTDIDECTLYQPCFQGRCINTSPGYQCLACPPGYLGTYEDALAMNITRRVFVLFNQEYDYLQIQRCDDVDECATDNGGCDVNSDCSNTIGSYSCGFCKTGWLGEGSRVCIPDNPCTTGTHNCNQNATCSHTGPGLFKCECNHGFAGDGVFCDEDLDLDGRPIRNIVCSIKACIKDNCASYPNSGLEDNDGDNIGDLCDPDDDNDALYDYRDNCQYIANYDQTDTDGDGVGDACDTCPAVSNADQVDTDSDGQGDACDADDDNDGVSDSAPDNCQFVSNADQNDTDSDGVGDACDNCVAVANDNQTDSDQNGVGDACDVIGASNKDRDGDSILNFLDNCPYAPNPEQTDIDGDGQGDICDDDIDGDGVLNNQDNCPYVANAGQEDTNGDKVGDICETDTDGDGVLDIYDVCIKNPSISSTSFASYTSVNLYPNLAGVNDPQWELWDNGAMIKLVQDTAMPALLVGPQAFGPVDYSGTWYVDSDTGENYVGFVFGYQNNRKFYVVMWRHKNLNYIYKGGIKGLQLKLVNSNTGPGSGLAKALWNTHDTADKVTLLWQDPTMTGWEHKTPYRWHLKHRPSIGLIRITVVQGTSVIVDSGDLYDTTISGGRLGVFMFDQPGILWSFLETKCVDRVNEALYFDGTDDYVTMANITSLEVGESFTLEAWVYLSSGYPTSKLPILCTLDSTLCMYVEGGVFKGTVGTTTAVGSNVLPDNYWNHLLMRYDAQSWTLSLFINGSTAPNPEAHVTNIEPVTWTIYNTTGATDVYLGRDRNNFFAGILDEIRIYDIVIPDSEIDAHIQEAGLVWQRHQGYLNVHYTMDSNTDTSLLQDHGLLGINGVVSGNPLFVDSLLDHGRFQLTYPSNRRRRRRNVDKSGNLMNNSHEEL